MAKRNVGILIFPNVEVLDFAGPYEVFSRVVTADVPPPAQPSEDDDHVPFRVFTVAQTTEPVLAIGGLRVIPEYSFTDAPPIDVLVVPGGYGTRPLLEDPAMLDWVHNAAEGAETVTSVCTGALLYAKLGLLAGRRATTHWGALDLLAGLDPTIQVDRESRWVDDGIVTSAGVAAGIDMALYVVESLCGAETAERTARYIELVRHGPDERRY
ncbi:MAG: DJ-1/PfpI family protein [Acidobacteriota bacterium]